MKVELNKIDGLFNFVCHNIVIVLYLFYKY